MSAHNLDSQMHEKLPETVARHDQQIREIRTLQRNSANAIQVVATPSGDPLEIDAVVAAGDEFSVVFQIIPSAQILTTWNLFFSVFVDLPAYPTLDLTYRIPGGFSLSAGARKMAVSYWGDWARSDDLTGMRWYNVTVRNNDSASHHIYVLGKFYGPYTQSSTGI